MILLGGVPREDRERLDEEIDGINNFTKRELLTILEVRREAIKELDEKVGFLASGSEYIRVVDTAMKNPKQLYMVPKFLIDTRFFRRYEAFYPRWSQFPPHARFGIDARGQVPFTGRTVEWRLLEAALFEDVAMLWNESLAHRTDAINVVGDDRIPGKRYEALKRSTVRAVFASVEGYINGVGVDIELTSEVAGLPASQREMLLERTDDGRPRFKSLRDKVMQYPRIALQAEHPPIQAENEHLSYILVMERKWRDAVMHPTPRLEDNRTELREYVFFEVSLDELQRLVDSAIALIRQIDGALDGKFGLAALWIDDRGEDGRFRNRVFH
jgi:hypothetical protein